MPIQEKVKVVFDPAKHEYWVEGKKIPGVSEIMKFLGLSKDWSGVDTYYRDRGTAVHKAIELYIHGNLDEDSLDPVCVPYVEEFKEWWHDPLAVNDDPMTEQIFYSERFGFAGTIDLILTTRIWDFKTTKSMEHFTTEIQGAFYRQLVSENFCQLPKPFSALQLPGNGPAIEVPYKSELALVESVMTLYNKKRERR